MARDTWLRTANGLITDPNYVTALYDREIRYLDEGIAALNDALDKQGLAENTMVVLLADHGESMTDHRIFYDHYGLHDCCIQVPTIIRWPGGKSESLARGSLRSGNYPTLRRRCWRRRAANCPKTWTARAFCRN